MWRAMTLCLLLQTGSWLYASETDHGDTQIQLQLSFGSVVVQDVTMAGERWSTLECSEQALPGPAGAPALPWLTRLVEIPPTGSITFSYTTDDLDVIRGVHLLPEQERVSDDRSGGPLAFVQDNAIYSSSGMWPAQEVQVGDPVILRNRRMVKLTWYPCRWNPANDELVVSHELNLVIHTDAKAGVNEISQRIPCHFSPMDRLSEAVVDVPFAHGDEGAMRDIFERPALPGTYLVFGHSGALANALMQQFLEWKRSRGHVVHVEDESSIGSLTPGNIFQTINDYYYNSEYPPDFVMLIGDPDGSGDFSMPAYDSNYDGLQDHGYSLIEGDDILGDLAVGRISVTSQSQLASVLTKIMGYEQSPTIAGTSWLTHAALSTGYNAVSMVHLCRSVVQRYLNAGFTDIDTLWYNSNSSWVDARFNEGISQYCYRGWIGMNGVDADYVDNHSHFTNSGRCPIACIFTCATGDYNGGYSTTEAFLRKGSIDNPRGAVAAMGFSTSATHTAYNNAVVAGYYSGIHDLHLPIGPAMFRGKYNLWATLPEGDTNARAFSNRANLMGDPGLDDWNGLPTSLSLSCEEGTTISYGQALLTFHVQNELGTDVEGAVVCVYQSGDLQERALTGPDGIARLSIAGAEAGSFTATASGRNLIPQTLVLQLAESTSMLALTGADPEYCIPGAVSPVAPLLRNGGSTDLTGIELQFATLGDTYTLSDSTSSIGTLTPSQEATGDVILVSPVAGLGDYQIVDIPVELSTDAGSRTDCLRLMTHAPRLELGAALFNDAEILQPGENIDVQFSYTNTGHLDAQGLSLTLSCDDPAVTFIGQPDGPVSLSQGVSAWYHSAIDLEGTIFDGAPLRITCDWECSNGPSGSVTHVFYVGMPQGMSPTGPDDYGYYAYEDMDNNTKSPVYDWREISIIGTQLPISDTSDEDDQSMRVTLPFEFVYYGESYSSVAVCTNGYIAFGEGAENDPHYRNHALPSATGPNGMIAPFWDDLQTISGGGIFTYYDVTDHVFIVQWNNMNSNGSGGRNTFELLLLDPAYHTTESGDGDFVMQWSTWDNSQSNFTDFPYCSVGIESLDNLSGLSLSNYGIEAPTIYGMYAGKAICFSTDRGDRMTNETNPPIVSFAPIGITRVDTPTLYHCTAVDPSGVSGVILHVLDSSGDASNVMHYNVAASRYEYTLPARDLGDDFDVFVEATDGAEIPNTAYTDTTHVVVSAGYPPSGPDGYGHLAMEAMDVGGSAYNWVDISNFGVSVDFNYSWFVNREVSTLNLVWFGEDFDEITLSVFGAFYFGNVYPEWIDTSPMAAGHGIANQVNVNATWYEWYEEPEIYLWVDEIGGRLILSWENMTGWNDEGQYYTASFQAIIYDAEQHPTTNGDSAILFQYREIGDLVSDHSIGFQDGNTTDGLNLYWNGGYIEDLSDLSDATALLISSGWATEVPQTLQPLVFQLDSVWPNPFNPTARVSFQLPVAGQVELVLYNLLGQEVSQLMSAPMAAGSHSVMLDGEGLASGIYLLRLSNGSQQEVRRITLLR